MPGKHRRKDSYWVLEADQARVISWMIIGLAVIAALAVATLVIS